MFVAGGLGAARNREVKVLGSYRGPILTRPRAVSAIPSLPRNAAENALLSGCRRSFSSVGHATQNRHMDENGLRFLLDESSSKRRVSRLKALKLPRGAARRTTLRNIYLDTPDHALNKAEIALRLRREGRRWLQVAEGERQPDGRGAGRGRSGGPGPRRTRAARCHCRSGVARPGSSAGQRYGAWCRSGNAGQAFDD